MTSPMRLLSYGLGVAKYIPPTVGVCIYIYIYIYVYIAQYNVYGVTSYHIICYIALNAWSKCCALKHIIVCWVLRVEVIRVQEEVVHREPRVPDVCVYEYIYIYTHTQLYTCI